MSKIVYWEHDTEGIYFASVLVEDKKYQLLGMKIEVLEV